MVFGISVDSPFSQWNWLESFSADKGGRPQAADGELPPLVLLSDRDSQVVDAYGVEPIEINGARYASRATFVVDREGVLRYVNYDYQIVEDYAPLLEALESLE